MAFSLLIIYNKTSSLVNQTQLLTLQACECFLTWNICDAQPDFIPHLVWRRIINNVFTITLLNVDLRLFCYRIHLIIV